MAGDRGRADGVAGGVVMGGVVCGVLFVGGVWAFALVTARVGVGGAIVGADGRPAGQRVAAATHVPPRYAVLPAELTAEQVDWFRAQYALAGVPIFNDWRNPYGAGPPILLDGEWTYDAVANEVPPAIPDRSDRWIRTTVLR